MQVFPKMRQVLLMHCCQRMGVTAFVILQNEVDRIIEKEFMSYSKVRSWHIEIQICMRTKNVPRKKHLKELPLQVK